MITHIPGDWETYLRFRSQFASALDPERYTIQWLDSQVYAGLIHVAGADDACILIEFKVYPTGAMDVHGLLAAGDLPTIVEKLIPYAEQWGRERGCIGGLIESRAGWVRELKKSGWEIHQTTLRKVL